MARNQGTGIGTVARAYRWMNVERAGLVLAILGPLFAWVGVEIGSDGALTIGGVLFVAGFAMLYLGGDPWYCQNCGQLLGRRKPRRCGRCESNRISQRDPGVGEAVRVKRQR